jgi:hypothetical protein
MTMHDDALEPTPQDYGFPENPSVVNQQCWDRQEAFLKAFGHLGTIRAAARAIGIHRTRVNQWLSADLYSFKKRMDDARQEYREFLEDLTHERLVNPQGNRGSDILLMFRKKAEWPEKYREEVKILGIESSKQMLDRLRELAAKERQQQAALESGEGVAIEGVYRDMSSPEHGPVGTPTPQAEGRTAEPPVPMPNEPNPPVKRPVRGKGSAPPPQPGSPRQVNQR